MDYYQVIVGNIGSVHSSKSISCANRSFKLWMAESMKSYSRFAGERVTLIRSGEIFSDYLGDSK